MNTATVGNPEGSSTCAGNQDIVRIAASQTKKTALSPDGSLDRSDFLVPQLPEKSDMPEADHGWAYSDRRLSLLNKALVHLMFIS